MGEGNARQGGKMSQDATIFYYRFLYIAQKNKHKVHEMVRYLNAAYLIYKSTIHTHTLQNFSISAEDGQCLTLTTIFTM